MQGIGSSSLGTFKVGNLHEAVQAARLKAAGQPFSAGVSVTPPKAAPTGWQHLKGAAVGGDVAARITQFQGARSAAVQGRSPSAQDPSPVRLHDRKIRGAVGENIQKLTSQILAPRLYQRSRGETSEFKPNPQEKSQVGLLVAKATERKTMANPWTAELKLAARAGGSLQAQVTEAALLYATADPSRSVAENLTEAIDQMFRPISDTASQRLSAAVAEEKRDPAPKGQDFRPIDQVVLEASLDTFMHGVEDKLKGQEVDLLGANSFTAILEHEIEERCPDYLPKPAADPREASNVALDSVNFYFTRLA